MQSAYTSLPPSPPCPFRMTPLWSREGLSSQRSPVKNGTISPLKTIVLSIILNMLVLPIMTSTQAFSEEQGHKDSAILLGMSTALTGPADMLGVNMRAGVQTAIEEVNRTGGVHGRKLALLSQDDGYEPARTAPNMRKLIEEDHVLAIIGNVGTPTAVAAIPIANSSKTPFFGAFTGAGILRKTPPDRYVINYRASYEEETTAMVDALINYGELKPEEIGFFTQRDAYGDAGFVGGIAALRRHGLNNEHKVIHTRYERNTLSVENALANLMLAEPPLRAVIMVGAYAPCAAFIRLAKAYGLDVIFLNVSFVGAEPLAEQLGDLGNGVIVTQVVPHFDSQEPIVDQYRKALHAWDASVKPSSASLEGYIATRIFCRALANIQGSITQESIVTALEGLDEFDIGMGVPLRLAPDEHQACHRVWPTIMQGGKIVPFRWEYLKKRIAGK